MSRVMKAAAETAKQVASWSPAKQDYARRVAKASALSTKGEFSPMEFAPRDGTFVRLVNRFAEISVGHWQAHSEMKSGGAWFDRAGRYISPQPVAWATE